MTDQEATDFSGSLHDVWVNPGKHSVEQMKQMLQTLERYREAKHCTETMYEIFEDMLTHMITVREKLLSKKSA